MDFLRKVYKNLFKKEKETIVVNGLLTEDERHPQMTSRRELEDIFEPKAVPLTEKLDDFDETIRWIPDDSLQKKYDKISKIVSTVPNKLYKLKESRSKIDQKKQQAEQILNNEQLTPFDRLSALELKQDIMKEESNIKYQEIELSKAQLVGNDPIFEQWAEYLLSAETFIQNSPELSGLIGSIDILNSTGIYVKVKQYMDQISLTVGERRDDAIYKLNILDKFFDFKTIHHNARGIHLLEFKNFIRDFNSKKEHLFDRLDFQIGGIDSVQKIPDRQCIEPMVTGIDGLGGSVVPTATVVDEYKTLTDGDEVSAIETE